MNANLVGYKTGGTTPLPASIAKMTAPASTVPLFEVINCLT
ncbi:MAG: hypothetical protein P4L33_07575 [Capsulimonadaceae bacterium]|nr:hypothetical protein [Capsulimonadaceae bacterium]